MMRKRGLAIFSILLLALTLIVGCSGDTGTSGSRAAQTTQAVLELLETTGEAGELTAETAGSEAAESGDEAQAAEAADAGETSGDTESAAPGEESAPAEEADERIAAAETEETAAAEAPETEAALDEDGEYNSKEDVALYIHLYGHLPDNYITKKEAESLGWSGGSLERYAPGKSIGGSRFGNYEGLLPDKKGRKYTECDIDTRGKKSRGAKRIVFSNDGLIYYTGDHYESFELLYGEE